LNTRAAHTKKPKKKYLPSRRTKKPRCQEPKKKCKRKTKKKEPNKFQAKKSKGSLNIGGPLDFYFLHFFFAPARVSSLYFSLDLGSFVLCVNQ
jgi:hypothetical protein